MPGDNHGNNLGFHRRPHAPALAALKPDNNKELNSGSITAVADLAPWLLLALKRLPLAIVVDYFKLHSWQRA